MSSRGCRKYLSLLLPPVCTRSKSLGNCEGRSRGLDRTGSSICLTAIWSPDCTPEPTFTLSHSTLTHVHFYFNAARHWAKGSCCSRKCFLFSPSECLEKCSQQKGLNQEKTHCFHNRHTQNIWGHHNLFPHDALWREGRWEEPLLLLLTLWLFQV